MTNTIPGTLLQSLRTVKDFDEEAFIKVHEAADAPVSIRLNPFKPLPQDHFKMELEPVPWSRYGCYLPSRPSFTFDPLFHAGCYYVQEASSMFLEQAVLQHTDGVQPLRVLDACAAPGGKSTHLLSLLPEGSLLVSNEVIKSRTRILEENLIKWGSINIAITQLDPSVLARLEGFFDIIVTDAPCSGSGLFRKDQTAISEWSEGNVALCCGRQERIISSLLPALKENGLLIYSTCSYSPDENEKLVQYCMEELELESLKVQTEVSWNITEVNISDQAYGYRFWPYKLKGEGFFLAVMRNKKSLRDSKKQKKEKWNTARSPELAMVNEWTDSNDLVIVQDNKTLRAIPASISGDLWQLQENIPVKTYGLELGEAIHGKFIPSHALALSGIVNKNVPRVDCSLEQAVTYLQKGDFRPQIDGKGWKLVSYQNYELGWINALSGRINNYYPRDWRILKQLPTPPPK